MPWPEEARHIERGRERERGSGSESESESESERNEWREQANRLKRGGE